MLLIVLADGNKTLPFILLTSILSVVLVVLWTYWILLHTTSLTFVLDTAEIAVKEVEIFPRPSLRSGISASMLIIYERTSRFWSFCCLHGGLVAACCPLQHPAICNRKLSVYLLPPTRSLGWSPSLRLIQILCIIIRGIFSTAPKISPYLVFLFSIRTGRNWPWARSHSGLHFPSSDAASSAHGPVPYLF